MNSIRIGNEERPLAEADPHWITQQINGRRRDGQSVCVAVAINAADIDMRLATPGCGGGVGAPRPPRPREREIQDLWTRHHLDQRDFSPGDVVSFVRQLQRYI